jgi:hypothetical protein
MKENEIDENVLLEVTIKVFDDVILGLKLKTVWLVIEKEVRPIKVLKLVISKLSSW